MSQYIEHRYKNLSPLFDDIETLYTVTSDTPSGLFTASISDACKNIVNIFNTYSDNILYTKSKQYEKLQLSITDNRNLILCFSGGKDSVAAALHYRDKYNVFLYHMQGINKGYVRECNVASALAEKLELPIYIEPITLHGNHKFVEHPMKNMLIANGALHYGINNAIGTKIAFANYYTSYLYDNAFEVCAGDCVEMWKAYSVAIRKIIPGFRMFVPLRNIGTSFNYIAKNPELLPYIISCVGPHRYQNYWKKSVEEKYNIRLLPNRCGRCWKCCLEYIYFSDNDTFEYNEKYYRYCLKALQRTYFKEYARKLHTLIDIWDNYCFYDIKKSKLFKEYGNVTV